MDYDTLAEWDLPPINDDREFDINETFDEGMGEEDEKFPTSTISEHPAPTVTIGKVDTRKLKMPNEVGNILEKILSMVAPEQPLDEEIEEPPKEIKLRPLGIFLQMLLLSLIGTLTWFVNKLKSRARVLQVVNPVMKSIKSDIRYGIWNDVLSYPDESIEKWFPDPVVRSIDFLFIALNYIIEHNRVFLPILTFILGYLLSA